MATHKHAFAANEWPFADSADAKAYSTSNVLVKNAPVQPAEAPSPRARREGRWLLVASCLSLDVGSRPQAVLGTCEKRTSTKAEFQAYCSGIPALRSPVKMCASACCQ